MPSPAEEEEEGTRMWDLWASLAGLRRGVATRGNTMEFLELRIDMMGDMEAREMAH